MTDTPEAAAREVARRIAEAHYGVRLPSSDPLIGDITAALLSFRRAALEEAAKATERCRDAWERDKRTFPPSGAANMVALFIRGLAGSTKEGE